MKDAHTASISRSPFFLNHFFDLLFDPLGFYMHGSLQYCTNDCKIASVGEIRLWPANLAA